MQKTETLYFYVLFLWVPNNTFFKVDLIFLYMSLDLFLKYLNSLQTSQDDSEIYVKDSILKFGDQVSGPSQW